MCAAAERAVRGAGMPGLTSPSGGCRIAPVGPDGADWAAAHTITVESARLSLRQARILTYIADHLDEYGYPPSLRAVAAAVGLSSLSTVVHHVRALRDAGHLAVAPPRRRAALRLVRPGEVA